MVLFHDVAAGVKLEVETRERCAVFLLEIPRAATETRETANRSLTVIARLLASDVMHLPKGIS